VGSVGRYQPSSASGACRWRTGSPLERRKQGLDPSPASASSVTARANEEHSRESNLAPRVEAARHLRNVGTTPMRDDFGRRLRRPPLSRSLRYAAAVYGLPGWTVDGQDLHDRLLRCQRSGRAARRAKERPPRRNEDVSLPTNHSSGLPEKTTERRKAIYSPGDYRFRRSLTAAVFSGIGRGVRARPCRGPPREVRKEMA